MQKRTRTIIFFLSLLLFFAISSFTILYSQGYRFNLKTKKITQTGGIFLKVLPSPTKIYINKKLKDKTSLIFKSALIQNLSPKFYHIRIDKDGYYSWDKNVDIKEKQVTEFKNIVLIPKNPSFIQLEKNVENFWFSPSKNKVIYEKVDKKTDEWNLTLVNLQLKTSLPIASEKDILRAIKISQKPQSKIEITNLRWSSDEEKILIKINANEKTRYLIIDLNKKQNKITSLDFLKGKIKEVSFNPKNPNEIFSIISLKAANDKNDGNNLLIRTNYINIDLKGKKTRYIPFVYLNSRKAVSYTIWQEYIIWLSSNGFIYKTDINTGRPLEVLNIKPLPIEKNRNYKIITRGDTKTFLKEDNILYYLNPKSRELKEIARGVNLLKFSPDFKKIVYTTNSEIWTFYLENIPDQPKRKSQDRIFLERWTNKINEIYWFTDHYLIFTTGNNIKIIETDNRDKINVADLPEIQPSKFLWDQSNNRLYVLVNKNLIMFNNLLP